MPPSQPSDAAIKAVKAIWAAVSQAGPDGKKYLTFVSRTDLVYLFCTGFVDESKHTVHDWVESFKDSLQPDGSYRLSEEQWMDKARFRYCGPVGRPFDALLIKEGEWQEKEMETLIRLHILPAVYFTEKEFRSIFDEARESFFSGGVYKITRAVKEDLKKLIDMYPSPAQVRALGLAEARAERSGQKGSGYSTGQAQSQVAAQRLSDLLNRSGGK
ncbi:MAG TPA: hypothetical protein VFX30_14205 [bacterium]|nr:hypothetical protein [bacterium]